MTDNQRKRWAGLVVLYNPMEEVIDNIKTYADSLDKLYILDNTDRPLQWVAKASKDIPSAQYIAF